MYTIIRNLYMVDVPFEFRVCGQCITDEYFCTSPELRLEDRIPQKEFNNTIQR